MWTVVQMDSCPVENMTICQVGQLDSWTDSQIIYRCNIYTDTTVVCPYVNMNHAVAVYLIRTRYTTQCRDTIIVNLYNRVYKMIDSR